MISWNSANCDYDSEAFRSGFAAGKDGAAAQPITRSGQDYDSYMEGWLMGDCEKDIEQGA